MALFRRRPQRLVPRQLYDSVVAQARQKIFFTAFGFADSVTGRFDLLALHLFLFSRRLAEAGTPLATALSQEVFDVFTAELDTALREIGIGDTSVPKRKKKLVRSFYALIDELAPPLDKADRPALEAALAARFYPGEEASGGAYGGAFADYLLAGSKSLAGQSLEAILAGELAWPPPEPYMPRKSGGCEAEDAMKTSDWIKARDETNG